MTTLQTINASASPEVQMNENFETVSAAGVFGKRQSVTTGLVWGYYGGFYNGNTIADGAVTQTNTADNYVVVLRSTGVVSVSTSSTNSLDPLYAKLYKNTVAGGVVTVSVDQRWDVNGLFFTPGASGSSTGTVTHTAGALTASAVMVGNGAADAKVLASLGTTTTVLHGNAAGLPTWAAVSLTADVSGVLPIANFTTGTPTGSKFVRDDGVLAVPAGSGGTVTHTGGALTSNAVVLGAGTDDSKVVAGIITDGTSVLTLGVAGGAVGSVAFKNATSGTLTIAPPTGALGTVTVTVPAATDTLANLAGSQAFTNKTYNGNTLTAGTYTLTGTAGKTLTFSNSLTLAGTDSTTMTFPPASASIGYLNIPTSTKSADYTIVAADAGTCIEHPASDTNARTFTIDSVANQSWVKGTAITIKNETSQVVSIAVTGQTLTLAGTTTTGTRSLAQNGIATFHLNDARTVWLASGTGLT